MKSSLLFGMGRSSSELQMSVGAVEPAGDDLFFVDIEILIPMKILTIRQTIPGPFVPFLGAAYSRTCERTCDQCRVSPTSKPFPNTLS